MSDLQTNDQITIVHLIYKRDEIGRTYPMVKAYHGSDKVSPNPHSELSENYFKDIWEGENRRKEMDYLDDSPML